LEKTNSTDQVAATLTTQRHPLEPAGLGELLGILDERKRERTAETLLLLLEEASKSQISSQASKVWLGLMYDAILGKYPKGWLTLSGRTLEQIARQSPSPAKDKALDMIKPVAHMESGELSVLETLWDNQPLGQALNAVSDSISHGPKLEHTHEVSAQAKTQDDSDADVAS
jgi:hypothetical protein